MTLDTAPAGLILHHLAARHSITVQLIVEAFNAFSRVNFDRIQNAMFNTTGTFPNQKFTAVGVESCTLLRYSVTASWRSAGPSSQVPSNRRTCSSW